MTSESSNGDSSTSTEACNISAADVTHHTRVLDTSDCRKVYLSVIWQGGCLGAAYYESDTCVLHVLLQSGSGGGSGNFAQLENLVEELSPAAVVTSAKQDEAWIAKLQDILSRRDNKSVSSEDKNEQSSSDDETEDPSGGGCALEILTSTDFRLEASKRRLFAVNLPTIPEHYDDRERVMHISSLVPLECVESIRAVGGLLRYMEKKRVSVGLENADVRTPILRFQTFALKRVLYLDKISYSALQIFSRVRHPSAFKSGSREGLSLFGVLNRTSTLIGHKLLRSWFYRPTSDRQVLTRRLEAVSFFVNPRNEETCESIRGCLPQVKNVARMLSRIKTSKLSVTEWQGLAKTAHSALRIADVCRAATKSANAPAIFSDIATRFTEDLAAIVNLVGGTMDVEQSRKENVFVVRAGISPELDEMKDIYLRLPALLSEVANRSLQTYREYFSACQVMYMRRIGYLLYASTGDFSQQQQGVNISELTDLEFVAESDGMVYYRSPDTKQLDEHVGDVLENITYQEIAITNRLQDHIVTYGPVLLEVMELLAELDCLVSFAVVARELSYVRPSFRTERGVRIVGGRHPLQEHTVPMFVPNDVEYDAASGQGIVKILTGPNASGKSIYLKQVGLLVFMAHLGSFVPAESAVIGELSRIFTRIRGQESISSGMSSFATDLNQMSASVREADGRSLILIDEFGKGTATVDGVALLAAFLTHWASRGADGCPLVLCATHFHSLVRQSLLPKSPLFAYVTMDTTRDVANTVCLYQLVEGVSARSQASRVAQLAGLPGDLIKRGIEVSEMLRRNAPVRQYYRSSSITYQRRCREVAERAASLDLDASGAVGRLLADVTDRLGSPKRGKRKSEGSFSLLEDTSPTSSSTENGDSFKMTRTSSLLST